MGRTDKNKLQEGRQELERARQAYDKNRCKKTLATKRRAGEICNALKLGLRVPEDRETEEVERRTLNVER